jgi:hypothetical protein
MPTRAGTPRRGRIRPRRGRVRLRWEPRADRATSLSSSTPSLHQAVLDAEEDAFFITTISVRRYTTNCNHAYQIEMMFPCMRATKVYESKGDQYLVVLWPPFSGCSGLMAPMPWDFEGIVNGV